MKTKRISSNVLLIAKRSQKQEKKLDYYIVIPNRKPEYAFTRDYTSTCYQLCKSGLSVNEILKKRNENRAYMNLRKYLQFILPYFIEYMEIPVVEKTKKVA